MATTDEQSVDDAYLEQRRAIVRAATKRMTSIENEQKSLNDRKSTIYTQLKAKGISKDAFKEAYARAKKSSDQLDLLDQEVCTLENLIRESMHGSRPAEESAAAENDDTDSAPADQAPAAAAATEDKKAKKEKKTKAAKNAEPKVNPPAAEPALPPPAPEEQQGNVTSINARNAGKAQPGFVERVERVTAEEYNQMVKGAPQSTLQ